MQRSTPSSFVTARERRWLNALRARFTRCTDGDAEACADILHPEDNDWAPLPKIARTSLLVFALEQGGEGAYGRLLASEHQDVRALLQTAAGVPADALLERWASRIAEARPVVHDDLGIAGAVSLIWILAFAGAAAGGSGRKLP